MTIMVPADKNHLTAQQSDYAVCSDRKTALNN